MVMWHVLVEFVLHLQQVRGWNLQEVLKFTQLPRQCQKIRALEGLILLSVFPQIVRSTAIACKTCKRREAALTFLPSHLRRGQLDSKVMNHSLPAE